MRAIIYTKYGSPDQLHPGEMAKPIPRKNEVLIKVQAASINSWDWDLLKGKPVLVRLLGGLSKPKHQVLGADIAGIVESVGPDVKSLQPGDAVFGDIAGSGFGGFAEYATASEKLLAKIPAGMSMEQAACLPQAGLLALQGLRYKKPLTTGQQLLINGAGGAVGTLALQFAKYIGATVTCVDKEEKSDTLLSLGADHFIDYQKQDYTAMGIQYDYIGCDCTSFCSRLPADIETIRCICYDWRLHGWFIAADDVIATPVFIIQKKETGYHGLQGQPGRTGRTGIIMYKGNHGTCD